MIAREMPGLPLMATGVAVGVLWATGRISNPFALVVAILLFLTGASFFGKTSRFAERLRPLIGKSVRVTVWGSELPDHAGCKFRVQSVRSLGAGLHLYLRPLPDGSSIHLKVAQPLETIVGDSHVEISHGKYVEWAGRKIRKDEREKALILIVES